jgi:hypothetical protein
MNEYIKPILDSGFDLMHLNKETLPVFKEKVLAYAEKGAFSRIFGRNDYKRNVIRSCSCL